MTFVATFIALALGGIINSAWLTYQHYKKKPLICPLEHDCSIVTESKWSSVLGIRNEVLGILFYVFMFGAVVVALASPPPLAETISLLLIFLASGGAAYSAFLAYIQFFVIKDYCFYCLISAALTVLLLINSFFIFKTSLWTGHFP